MFEYEAVIHRPATGEGDNAIAEHDEKVTLKFKPYGDVPGRVSRYNQGNIERQLWLSIEWGLAEPKHWPESSDLPGHLVFDELSQRQITDLYNAWQKHEEDDDNE